MANNRRYRERAEVKRSGKLGAFLLGILMGIIILAGAVGGAGYYIWSRPVNKTVGLIDKVSKDGDLYDKLFNEENGILDASYADKKVKDLLKDTLAAMTALSGGGSLQDVDNVSPQVGKTVDEMLKATDKYGIPFEKEALMSKPVNEISKYMEEQIQETPLGGMMEGTGGKEITDPILKTVCYGPASHYTTVNGEIVMKQVIYRVKAGVNEENAPVKILCDIDGEPTEGTYDEAKKTVVLSDTETHYLKQEAQTSEFTVFKAYVDAEHTTPAYYQQTKIKDFSTNSANLFNDVLLSDALNVNNASHKVLISLAYGNEGENYTVNDDGTITLINGSKPRTIGQLKKENNDLINDIALKDALNITAKSHKVLISLAYGTKDVDYRIVNENGEDKLEVIEPAKPRTLGELTSNGNGLINDVALTDVLEENRSIPVIMYMLYGKKGIHYAFENNDPNGKIVWLQKRIAVYYDGEAGTYTLHNEYGELIEMKEGMVFDHANGLYTDSQGNEYWYDASAPIDEIETKLADGKRPEGGSKKAKVYYLYEQADHTKPVTYSPATLGSLNGKNNSVSNLTARLTVSDLFKADTVSKNIFLKHLTNTIIDDLPDAIETLTVTQVYEDSVYKKNGDEFVYENGKRVINPEWWYLLHDENAHATHVGCDGMCINESYTTKDVGTLVTNMKTNVNIATIQELSNAGLIDLSPTEIAHLQDPVPDELLGDPLNLPSGTKWGQLTIVQLLHTALK